MHASRLLLIKKLDIAIVIFYLVILKICPKLWTYFTLKLSWPVISDRTNVKKLNKYVRNGLMLSIFRILELLRHCRQNRG